MMTRFAPYRSTLSDVAFLQNRLSSLFHDLAQPGSPSTETLATGNFVPAVDVYEDAQKLVLKLEIPGVRKEDLDIQVEGRVLTVKGERKFDSSEKEENFTRVERRFGSFVRSFTLPTSVSTEDVVATSQDGVLSIAMVRKPEAKARQIEVKASPVPQRIEAQQDSTAVA